MMGLYKIVCGILPLLVETQASAVKQDTGFISANIGDNVTLHCFYHSDAVMHFSWYRQTFGKPPELLSSIYKYDWKPKLSRWLRNNTRFSVQKDEGKNHLHINDIQCSDSAAYFCGGSYSNMVQFGEGVFLHVRGSTVKEIVQQPASDPVQSGSSVPLNCTVQTGTCDEDHRVYHGVLHSHGDQCKDASAQGYPSQCCVYHLLKRNLSSSDAGTYYCAVVSCGEIPFGRGSKLHIRDEAESLTAQMRVLVCLSIIRSGILLFFLIICLLVYITKMSSR